MPWMPTGTNPLDVPNKEPGRHYRWLWYANKQKFAQWLMSFGDRPGYRLEQGRTLDETKALAERLGFSIGYVDIATNRIVFGDLVLASIPQVEYERRFNEDTAEQRALATAVERGEDYKEALSDNPHVRPFAMQLGEWEDRKNHATREGQPVVSMARTN